jgi:beta-lactamase superfamily II metal-dependent hydrolase
MAIVAAIVLLPLSLLTASHWMAPWRRAALRVTAIDVGEGDSILVRTPSGRTMLVDGGGDKATDIPGETGPPESPIGERMVVPYLRSQGIDEVDVVLITHPHGDHVGGLVAVVRDLKVDTVLDGTTLPYPSVTYRNLIGEIRAKHVSYHFARRGEKIDFGDGVHADILNPPAGRLPYGTDFGDKTMNNYSAVVRLSYGSTVFLLDGDAETEAEANILRAYPESFLRANVLKAGHHGSRNASSDAWLAVVQPTAAIISCGRNNVFGHPHPEALARLRAHHVAIYRTDLNGAVEADSDGTNVTVKAYVGGPS